MKLNHIIKQFLFFFLLVTSIVLGCKKKDDLCETVSSKGRIIGYDPCRYYTPMTIRKDAGFVIEFDNGITKDTVVNYSIPYDLFQFPNIKDYAATNGQFLYAPDIQDKFKIKFNYRFALDNEKTAVPCLANIWTGPFYNAVKGKEIFITCISPQ
ncbi:MAG: hypothetical protein WKF85_10915 [Chitinophagaceae bacterium]